MKKIIICFFVLITISDTLYARDWYEYNSNNFSLYSDVSKREGENLLRKMEDFRQGILLFTGLKDVPENNRLRILHFNNEGELKKLVDDRNIAGLFRDTWDGPMILSSAGGGSSSGASVMFHEYVHYLMRERSSIAYPLWYSEGYAELLASADVHGERVIIGNLPEWRANALKRFGPDRMMTISELFAPDYNKESPRYWHRYYAASWFFTHYLLFGPLSGNPAYGEQLGEYLKAYAAGEDVLESFPSYFGKTIDEMQRELEGYKRDSLYGYRISITPYKMKISRRELGYNERYSILAGISDDMSRHELALKYLDKTDEKQSGWQRNLVLRAIVEGHKGGSSYSKTVISQLEEVGWSDWLTTASIAHYYVDCLDAAIKEGQWDDECYQKTVAYSNSAIEADPRHISSYRYLWLAYQHKGNTVAAVKTMMAAYRQDPKSLYINRELGFYLASTKRRDLAVPFLKRVVAWSHPGKGRDRAGKLLAAIEADTVLQEQAKG